MSFQKEQGDFFNGCSLAMQPDGTFSLEGTVDHASKVTGLSRTEILDMTKDGTIRFRQPGAYRKKKLSKNHKKFLLMPDVYRVAYGDEAADKMLREMGLNPCKRDVENQRRGVN